MAEDRGAGRDDGWTAPRFDRVWRVLGTIVIGAFLLLDLWVVPDVRDDATALAAGTVVAVFLAAAFVARVFGHPGRDVARPKVTRVDDGTGTVDAVLFGPRTLARWCALTALVLTDVDLTVTVVRQAAPGEPSDPRMPLLLAACLVVTAVVLFSLLRTRFLAVTAENLVVALGTRRMRIPWDDLANAHPVLDLGYSNPGPSHRITRLLVLTLSPGADPDYWIPDWFGKVGHEITLRDGTAALWFPGDRLSAPNALLHAIEWHLTAPRTLDALINGYEREWPPDVPADDPPVTP